MCGNDSINYITINDEFNIDCDDSTYTITKEQFVFFNKDSTVSINTIDSSYINLTTPTYKSTTTENDISYVLYTSTFTFTQYIDLKNIVLNLINSDETIFNFTFDTSNIIECNFSGNIEININNSTSEQTYTITNLYLNITNSDLDYRYFSVNNYGDNNPCFLSYDNIFNFDISNLLDTIKNNIDSQTLYYTIDTDSIKTTSIEYIDNKFDSNDYITEFESYIYDYLTSNKSYTGDTVNKNKTKNSKKLSFSYDSTNFLNNNFSIELSNYTSDSFSFESIIFYQKSTDSDVYIYINIDDFNLSYNFQLNNCQLPTTFKLKNVNNDKEFNTINDNIIYDININYNFNCGTAKFQYINNSIEVEILYFCFNNYDDSTLTYDTINSDFNISADDLTLSFIKEVVNLLYN